MQPRSGLTQALHVDEADMANLAALRERLRPQAADAGIHLTFLPFLVIAAARALVEHPTLNARLDPSGERPVPGEAVHVGIPVDTPSGPVTPVLRDAGGRELFDVARSIQSLAAAARAGTLEAGLCVGPTFTVSNVGSVGGLFAAPLVAPPEVAILGLNRIHERPIVRDDHVVVRPMMYVSLAYDRRAVDGAEAARFASAFIRLIERPHALA